jgi:hypothetical protein
VGTSSSSLVCEIMGRAVFFVGYQLN